MYPSAISLSPVLLISSSHFTSDENNIDETSVEANILKCICEVKTFDNHRNNFLF